MHARPSAATAAAAAAVALTAVAALLGPADATSAAPAKETDVRVTISDSASAGRVLSARPACERRVGVTVLITGSEGLGYFGEDQTDRDGRWDLRPQRRGDTSRAFAIVPGDSGACTPAQSAKVALLPRRAADPATVRISLNSDATRPPRGRVSSPRAGCERGADVVLFVRESGGTWSYGDVTRTDSEGRYTFAFGRTQTRRTALDSATVALASRGCDIAQSATVRPR